MLIRLKELRLAHRLTQRELADVLHVQQNVISYYESGQRSPCLDLLVRISDYFNVSTDYLCGKSNISKRISENEEKIILFYREANPDDKKNVFMKLYDKLKECGELDK